MDILSHNHDKNRLNIQTKPWSNWYPFKSPRIQLWIRKLFSALTMVLPQIEFYVTWQDWNLGEVKFLGWENGTHGRRVSESDSYGHWVFWLAAPPVTNLALAQNSHQHHRQHYRRRGQLGFANKAMTFTSFCDEVLKKYFEVIQVW